MSYTVSGLSLESINLSPGSTTEEVLQNLAVILATPQYSVPLDRALGLPQRFLDMPIEAAKPVIIAEVMDAVEAYEPRAEIVSVSFEQDTEIPGRLIPILEVNINE